MTRRLVVLGALLALIAVPASVAASSAVTNGSFEGTTSIGQFTTLGAGSTAIDGWTVSAGNVDWIDSYWTAFDGSRSLDLNGWLPGTLTQHVPTTVGADYVVHFYLAGNPDCTTVKTLAVSATGGATTLYTFDTPGTSHAAMGWTQQSYAFTATHTDTLLTFASMTAGGCGPALDMVSMGDVTPPAPPAVQPTKDDCKAGGWRSMSDADGTAFRNQGDCVSYFATDGRNTAAGAR